MHKYVTYVTWQGAHFLKLSEDDTEMSKHVAANIVYDTIFNRNWVATRWQ
jgi:hypothetical protein